MAERTVILGTVFSGKIDASFTTSINAVKDALASLTKVSKETTETLKAPTAQFKSIAASQQTATKSTTAYNAAQKSTQTSSTALSTSLRGLVQRYRDLVSAVDSGTISTQKAHTEYVNFGAGVKNASAQLNLQVATFKTGTSVVGEYRRAITSLTKATTDLYGIQSKAPTSVNLTRQLQQSAQLRATLLSNAKASFQARQELIASLKKEGLSVQGLTGKYKTLVQAVDAGTISTKAAHAAYMQSYQARKQVAAQTEKQTAATKKGAKAVSGYTKVVKALGVAFKRMASYMFAGRAIMLFTQAITGGIAAIGKFDQALHNLKAITGATDSQLLSMKTTLLRLAQNTKFSMNELAQGMTLLGQAGFTASESLGAIDATATLSSATLAGMETTTQLLTTSVRAFNLSAIESGRVADVMANAINKSKLTIDKLNTSFNYVGVTASQAGLSIEQTAATMMVLANNGLRASTIGTGLRQVLSRLIAPNKKLQVAFKEQNIELSKVSPAVVGYEESLKSLAKILWDSEKGAVNMSKAFSLFGLRGAQAAAVIIKAYMGGQFDAALGKVKEVGTAEKMAGEQAKGLAFKFKNLKDVMGAFAVTLGDAGLLGTFKKLVDVIAVGFKGAVSFMRTDIGGLITQIVLLTSGLMALRSGFMLLSGMTVFSGLISGAKAVVSSLFTVQAALIETNVAGMSLAGTTHGLIGLFATFPVFTAVAAFSALALGLKYVAETEERLAEQHKKTITTLEAQIGEYDLYAVALEDLAKKEKQGIDVKQDEEDIIKRLTYAYPELSTQIKEQEGAVTGLVKILRDQQRIAVADKLKEEIALAEQYAFAYSNLTAKITEYKYTEEEAKIVTEKYKESLSKVVASLIATGKEQGKYDAEIIKSVDAWARAQGASVSFAQVLKDAVAKALSETAKALNVVGKESKTYTELMIANTKRIAESMDVQTASEKEYVTAYRAKMKAVAKLLEEGSINAEQYRKREVTERKLLLDKIIQDRQAFYNKIKQDDSASKEELIAAERSLSLAIKKAHATEANDYKQSLEVKLSILKTKHQQFLLSDAEYYAAVRKEKLAANELDQKIAEESLKRLVVSGTAQKKEIDTVLKEIEKLKQEHYKILEGDRVADLAKQKEATQQELAVLYDRMTQVNQATKAGAEEYLAVKAMIVEREAQLSELSKQTQIAVNAELKQLYDADVLALKAAFAAKNITQEEYNQKKLERDKAYYAQVIVLAKQKMAALSKLDLEYSAAYKAAQKERDEAIIAVGEAEKALTATTETEAAKQAAAIKEITEAWDAVGKEGTAQYKLDLAELQLQYGESEQKSKKYLEAEKALFIQYTQDMIAAQKELITQLEAASAPIVTLNGAKTKLIELEIQLKSKIKETTGAIKEESNALGITSRKYTALASSMGLTSSQLTKVIGKLRDAGTAGQQGAQIAGAAWNAFAATLGTTVEKLKKAVGEVMGELKKATAELDHFEEWRKQTKRQEYHAYDRMSRQRLLAEERRLMAIQDKTGSDIAALESVRKALKVLENGTTQNSNTTQRNTQALTENTDALNSLNSSEMGGQYSKGGVVGGVGDTDNQLIKATPGEIVIPKSAIETNTIPEFISKLGKNFRVPSLNVSKLKVPGMSGSSVTQKVSEIVNLNFNIGNKSLPVQATPDVARALVAELKHASLVTA